MNFCDYKAKILMVKSEVELLKNAVSNTKYSVALDDLDHALKVLVKFVSNLTNIFDSINVDAIWDNSETRITDIIMKKDYEEALRYCCLEHTEVIVGVGKRFVSDYATVALGVLSEDKSLAAHIRNKYFSEINI